MVAYVQVLSVNMKMGNPVIGKLTLYWKKEYLIEISRD